MARRNNGCIVGRYSEGKGSLVCNRPGVLRTPSLLLSFSFFLSFLLLCSFFGTVFVSDFLFLHLRIKEDVMPCTPIR